MNDFSAAEGILKTMLNKLGFEITIATEVTEDGPCLNIDSEHSAHIIGSHGDRLEDIQYLLNRILAKKQPECPRIKVDCQHYRRDQEAELLQKVKLLADKVREDGKAARTRPLNAYYRRLVHNAFLNDAEIVTSSPEGKDRYKRVQLSKKEA